MDGEITPSWAEVREQYHDLIRKAAAALPGALARKGILVVVVLLTGWLSYESLHQLATVIGWSGLAAAAFPLQLDFAAIPAYTIAADRTRHWSHRWFGVTMVVATLGGSIYGNLVVHLRWGGAAPVVFASVISPAMCAMTLVIWHLPRVVAALQSASRWTNTVHPPESSADETEVTPEEPDAPSQVGAEDARAKETPSTLAPSLRPVGPRIPTGDWASASGMTAIRSFASAFEALNDRWPETHEVYSAMPRTREHRNVSTVLKQLDRGMTG